MSSTFKTLTLVAAFVMMCPAAYAAGLGQGQGPTEGLGSSQGGVRGACKDDVQYYCQGVQPGAGRILGCLEDHYKEISDACYTALKDSPATKGGQGNNSSAGNK